MATYLVVLAYLLTTSFRLYENSMGQAFYPVVLVLLLSASTFLSTWAGFLIRSCPDDWKTLRHRIQQPGEALSPLEIKEALATLTQLRHCLYAGGAVVSLVFWRFICEEPNPFGMMSSQELSLSIPAILPVIPVLLWDDWLNRQITRFDPAQSEAASGFWRTSILLLIIVQSILGNHRTGPGDEEFEIVTIAAVLITPLLVLFGSFVHKKIAAVLWRPVQ